MPLRRPIVGKIEVTSAAGLYQISMITYVQTPQEDKVVEVQTLIPPVPDAESEEFAGLFCTVYPNFTSDVPAHVATVQQLWHTWNGPAELRPTRFALRDNGRLLANATLVPRRVRTSRGEEMIPGMADVLTHP